MEYIFTLDYRLEDSDQNIDELIERLGAGGCTDALVGTGIAGRLGLEFCREAADAESALASALADVREAIPSARLIEASPDFVGLTDAAVWVGVSRQNMRKLMTTHAATFPLPVHAGSAGVWHLSDILDWLKSKGGYRIEERLHEVSKMALQVNLLKETRRLAQPFSGTLERGVELAV
jgi:predicted DNA-binding transcriptional regulator AlpA